MKMIRAVIRPEAVDKVADSLESGGFTALTRIEVFGRGKQKGIKVGNVVYDNVLDSMDNYAIFINGAAATNNRIDSNLVQHGDSGAVYATSTPRTSTCAASARHARS